MTRRPGTAPVAGVAGRNHGTSGRLLLAALAGAAMLLLFATPAFAIRLAAVAIATSARVAMAFRLWGRATADTAGGPLFG